MNRLLLAALFTPASASAASLEALSASAARDFASAPAGVRAALESAPGQPAQPAEPVLQPPLTPVRLTAGAAAGAVLGKIILASQLDKNLALMSARFGARTMDLGVAADAGFRQFFFAFGGLQGAALAPVGDINRLRGDGIDARIAPGITYNFRVLINIFNPVRGSTLHMSPSQGTAGPSTDVKTGAVLDAARARSTRVTIGGAEYWFFYGRDALADGSAFATTRSFLIIREAGLSSKVWPLSESALTRDAASVVDLGGTRAALTLTSAGELIVQSVN